MKFHRSLVLEGPSGKNSTLGLDFDLQDINLILGSLPGEELEVKKS